MHFKCVFKAPPTPPPPPSCVKPVLNTNPDHCGRALAHKAFLRALEKDSDTGFYVISQNSIQAVVLDLKKRFRKCLNWHVNIRMIYVLPTP